MKGKGETERGRKKKERGGEKSRGEERKRNGNSISIAAARRDWDVSPLSHFATASHNPTHLP